jgi:hypothetical protein
LLLLGQHQHVHPNEDIAILRIFSEKAITKFASCRVPAQARPLFHDPNRAISKWKTELFSTEPLYLRGW